MFVRDVKTYLNLKWRCSRIQRPNKHIYRRNEHPNKSKCGQEPSQSGENKAVCRAETGEAKQADPGEK